MTGPQTPRAQNSHNGLTGLSPLLLICLQGLRGSFQLWHFTTSKQATCQIQAQFLSTALTCQHLLTLIPLPSPEPPNSSNPRTLSLQQHFPRSESSHFPTPRLGMVALHTPTCFKTQFIHLLTPQSCSWPAQANCQFFL